MDARSVTLLLHRCSFRARWRPEYPCGNVGGMAPQKIAAALVAESRAEAAAQRIGTADLAARAGISKPSAYRYLAGERDLPLSVLLDFARVLGVPAAELLDRAQQRASSDA